MATSGTPEIFVISYMPLVLNFLPAVTNFASKTTLHSLWVICTHNLWVFSLVARIATLGNSWNFCGDVPLMADLYLLLMWGPRTVSPLSGFE